MKEEAAEPKTLEHLLRRHGELLAARDWLRTLTNDLSPASIPGYRTDGTSESILRMADKIALPEASRKPAGEPFALTTRSALMYLSLKRPPCAHTSQ